MHEIVHHLGALDHCNSSGFRDVRWCKISSITVFTISRVFQSSLVVL